jgi:hypothetical protein
MPFTLVDLALGLLGVALCAGPFTLAALAVRRQRRPPAVVPLAPVVDLDARRRTRAAA